MTVAIPTYRRPEMLREAIESALKQTYPNIEILVSDSAADPEIEALVASYGDPRLRYRHNGAVTDMSHNALAMFQAARGEFIGTLHDDDLWEADFLELLVPPLIADESLTLSFSDYWVIDVDGTVREDLTDAIAHERGRDVLAHGVHRPFTDLATTIRAIAMSVAAVFRAAAVDWSDWQHEAPAAYDMWLAYLLARDGAGAWYEPRRLTRNRQHPDAASSTARLDEAAVWAFDRFLADERLAAIRPELHRAAAPHHVGIALTALRERGPQARRVAARRLREAARGGLSPQLLVGCAIWLQPPAARRWVIDTVRRARAQRAGREPGPTHRGTAGPARRSRFSGRPALPRSGRWHPGRHRG
ncbi:glycosyltransferase family 2 protein [Geodermatophilus sp. SYSU D00758]